MPDIYTCSSQFLLENSRVPMRVLENEAVIYEEIAQITIDTIRNCKRKQCVIICPVGPIGQYPVLARKINEMNVSLLNTYFVNMDEYLDDDDRMIAKSSILSFRRIMDDHFYAKIKPELLMPESQRLFPVPGDERTLDSLLTQLGQADCCLTGVGINGHIAFNEPPENVETVSVDSFAKLGTRCLNLARETIVNNGANKVYGALDLMPKRCITIGMKQLLACKKIKVYLYCKWQWGIMRKIALEPVSVKCPASFLQLHPDSEMVVTKELMELAL